MARPLRIEYPGAVYHITARGNNGGAIYKTERDREKFLEYLRIFHERYGVKVHAYCLMVNHYHLIIETLRGNLCKYMHALNSSYTAYFNTKRKRKGHLLQGRYKSILVDKDSYIQELSRYVHLNPVRAKIVKQPEEFKWSSYMYYVAEKKLPGYMETEFTLRYFRGNKKRYKDFVEAGVEDKDHDIFKELKSGFILGDIDFVEDI